MVLFTFTTYWYFVLSLLLSLSLSLSLSFLLRIFFFTSFILLRLCLCSCVSIHFDSIPSPFDILFDPSLLNQSIQIDITIMTTDLMIFLVLIRYFMHWQDLSWFLAVCRRCYISIGTITIIFFFVCIQWIGYTIW